MAGAVLEDRAPGLRITTAGTHVIEGMPMSWRTRDAIAELGVEHSMHRSHQLTDFDVESADVVVLHRVVCCYPDADALVGASAAHARGALVLSYPPRAWWTRLFAALVNAAMRARGREYRAYMHAPATFLATGEARGLRRVAGRRSWPWRISVLER
jgi:hypothetical protein